MDMMAAMPLLTMQGMCVCMTGMEITGLSVGMT
jgi:hypothetical protein